MPHPYWSHVCSDGETVMGARECETCGRVGTWGGWSLGMIEHMGQYQLKYWLRPIGPHRPLTDELFNDTCRSCEACDGEGVLGPDENSWADCPLCGGTGGHWTITREEFDTRRRQVITAYPDAAVTAQTYAVVGPDGVRTLRDYGDGRLVDVTPENESSPSRAAVRLAQAAVQDAFSRARDELGSNWPLKGRAHCRRVTIRSHLARRAARGAPDCWQRLTPHNSSWKRRLFPLALVERAATLLGVPANQLVSQEF